MRKKKEKAEHKKSIWKDKEFLKKIVAEIETGALHQGNDALLKKVQEFCPQESLAELTVKALASRLDKLVWSAQRLNLLKKFVRLGLDLGDLYKQLSFLPKDLIDKKARELRGRSVPHKEFRAPSEAGIGRLMVAGEIAASKSKEVKLPLATRENPFKIPVKNPNRFMFAAIEGVWLGLKYNPIFDENIARNTLFWAEENGLDAVLLVGGLNFIDTKKSSGSLTTHRARLSGMNLNLDVIAEEYRKEAARIRKDLPPNEVVCQTLRERFLNLMRGYGKIALDDNDKPICKKCFIGIFLSRQEEEFIEAAADAEVNYILKCRRQDIEVKKKGKKAQLAHEYAADRGDGAYAKELEEKIAQLTALENRYRDTNADPEDRQRFVSAIRSFLVKCYEQAVPGAKVIAHGTAFVKMGNKVIEVHQDRNERPTDSFLDEFLKDDAGRRALAETLPDVVLLASALSLHSRWAAGECVKDKKRTSTHIFQLPVALDKKTISAQIHDVIRTSGHPVERLLRHPHFEPGVLALQYEGGADSEKGMWIPHILPVHMIAKFREHTSMPKRNGEAPYIYIEVQSDEHVGHRWKERYYDARSGKWLGHESAFAAIMRRNFTEKGKLIPIHFQFGLGDDLQSHNFETQNQPHPGSKLYCEIEKEFNAIRHNAEKDGTAPVALAKLKEIHEKALSELWYRGEDWVDRQFEAFSESVIGPNIDHYLNILRRNRKAGIKFVGAGPLVYGRPDSRDIAVITRLGGDHFGWTVKNVLMESTLYLRELIHRIRAEVPREFSEEELYRMIKAPRYGSTPCAWGVISAQGGYEWGISLRHEPTEVGGKNSDRILPTGKNVLARGDFSRIFAGKRTLHLNGGIHRYGLAQLPEATLISNPSGTDTDPYGERGWSPNNVGNVVVGLPAKGPEYGPIKVIPFNHDFVRECLSKPSFKIDLDEVFKDAL